jgi:hypothetical protein
MGRIQRVIRILRAMNAFMVCALTFAPFCASGEMNVAPCCANERSIVHATSHGFALFLETADDTQREPSWVFRRSIFTNDPITGARVAQYERKPPVEPLADQRNVTSSYRRTRTNLRGLDGSYDDAYQVQAWGNGRGGLDAEWERFHDAWKESILSGGYYNGPAYGPYGFGGGDGYGGQGYGFGGAEYGNGGWGGNGPRSTQGGWAPGYGRGQTGPPNIGGWPGGYGPYNGPSYDDWPRNRPNDRWQND